MRIEQSKTREIIEDFALEIKKKKMETASPKKTVIDFRTDRKASVERTVYDVPIEILRFRKDNGRIASDVLDYQINEGVLDEKEEETQEILRKFLKEKDPQKTEALRASILHAGQREPAIITADGFLINGNRRKMVMDELRREFPEKKEFAYMKVVILPGNDDEGAGGPPTLVEIEQIENRYQLQSDGKSEYYNFDRALSIKRKEECGLSLEAQLRDDPQYAEVGAKKLRDIKKKYERDYLDPIKCIDRYLEQFNRRGHYRWVSKGISDKEGRWQAFYDYAQTYAKYLANERRRVEYGIGEKEVGFIETAAFNIIRLRQIPGIKLHMVMRDLPKYCRAPEGKNEIVEIAKSVSAVLEESEKKDEKGQPLSLQEIDAKWNAKHKHIITERLHKARKSYEFKKERETPLKLLEAAYSKLTHDDMDLANLLSQDYGKAMSVAEKVKKKAKEIASEIYQLQKNNGNE